MSVDPWFIYRRENGRFRAMPANWQGWSFFIAVLACTVVLSLAMARMTAGFPFAVRFVALAAVILIGVAAICLVTVRKGRPSR